MILSWCNIRSGLFFDGFRNQAISLRTSSPAYAASSTITSTLSPFK
jgi:hypothetical protein